MLECQVQDIVDQARKFPGEGFGDMQADLNEILQGNGQIAGIGGAHFPDKRERLTEEDEEEHEPMQVTKTSMHTISKAAVFLTDKDPVVKKKWRNTVSGLLAHTWLVVLNSNPSNPFIFLTILQAMQGISFSDHT